MWFLCLLFFLSPILHSFLFMLNHPCIPGMKPTRLWCITCLMYCWIWFASILFRILPLCSSRKLNF
jgi:hypothetical protein